MSRLSRRQFLAGLGAAAAAPFWLPFFERLAPPVWAQSQQHHIYVARNGTPVTNVQRVIALAGGIQNFVGHDDAVVLKPNGQWPPDHGCRVWNQRRP